MKKRNRMLYWVTTIFLAIGMLAGGVQQMLQVGGYVDIASQLGYPLYLLSILGVWKILGVIAVLIPKAPVVKEWAYAGFFFAMSGAAISHLATGQPVDKIFPSLVLLLMTLSSWYFRPADRKINSVNQ